MYDEPNVTEADGCRESRRCSRDTYPESYITKYTRIRRLVKTKRIQVNAMAFPSTLELCRIPAGNSNSRGARPVHPIITMIKWTRTCRLSIKKSLSAGERDGLPIDARALPNPQVAERRCPRQQVFSLPQARPSFLTINLQPLKRHCPRQQVLSLPSFLQQPPTS